MLSKLIEFKNKFLENYRKHKKLYQIIIIPLISSLIAIIGQTPVAYCAFVILVMSLYWIFECVPIAIASIMPVFLFPMFGIMKTKVVTPYYFHDNVMFIFASLIIGLGIETTGLHQKIALRVCMLVGSEPKWILLGIMSATGFLSVWISNTATSSMILPIVVSIVKQIVKLDPVFKKGDSNVIQMQTVSTIEVDSFNSRANLKDLKEQEYRIELEQQEKEEKNNRTNLDSDNDEDVFKTKEAKNLIKAFCLSITYAATIGGTGSLIGTSSNIVFKGYFEEKHPNDALNFLTFMLYSLPISIILIFVCWCTLCIIWLPKGKFFDYKKFFSKSKKENATVDKDDSISNLIRIKYEKLGPYTWEQISIGSWFIIVVILWLTRDLYFVPGWSVIFKKDYITDSSTAVLVLLLAISWPKYNIFKGHAYEPLMTWKTIEKLFPWSIIFLIGGSLAMAEGCERSGLSVTFGDFLKKVLPNNKISSFLLVTVFSVLGTEFISNISMVSIMLPILDSLATSNKISYYYMILPQAIAVNFSYMFPAAAPSNAVVFAGGYLTLKDMIITGFILKILAYIVLFIASNTWLEAIFNVPFIVSNSTTIVANMTEITDLFQTTILN